MNYNSADSIGIGDHVTYKGTEYCVLINYAKGDTDRTGYTSPDNWTVLIDDDGNRTTCYDYRQLVPVHKLVQDI